MRKIFDVTLISFCFLFVLCSGCSFTGAAFSILDTFLSETETHRGTVKTFTHAQGDNDDTVCFDDGLCYEVYKGFALPGEEATIVKEERGYILK